MTRPDDWTPGRRSWRRWKLTRWLVHTGYRLGVVSASCHSYTGGEWLVWAKITGTRRSDGVRARPCYVAGWPVENWRCLLRFHHWPSQHKVGLGLCVKCCPCPDCGRPAPIDHDCVAALTL